MRFMSFGIKWGEIMSNILCARAPSRADKLLYAVGALPPGMLYS